LKFGFVGFIKIVFVFLPADKADIFVPEFLGESFYKFFVYFEVETIRNPLLVKFEEPVRRCFVP
jgi:hypothetical protein